MSSRAWTLACLALPVLSTAAMLAAPQGADGTLGWQGSAWPELWTLWSAALLDNAWPQWLANVGVMGLLAAIGWAMGATRSDAICLGLAWPLSTWGLQLFPDVQSVVGLDGVTHAAGAILLVRASRLWPHHALTALATGALLLKLGLEHAWKTPHAFNAHWAGNVTYAIHLTGAVAGAVLAYVVNRFVFKGAQSLDRR